MPRGGRRGRFWHRFHREENSVPPPPPPPNVDHIRWSFPSPARRGRRSLQPWLLDGAGSGSDGSPPSRWMAAHDQYYYEEDDRDSHHSGEICFICGDLVGSHPEVPSVHLCEGGGEYGYLTGNNSRNSRTYGRRTRRDHDPPGCIYRGGFPLDVAVVHGAGSGSGPAGMAASDKWTDQGDLEWLIERLQSSQLSLETMNKQMKDLCSKLKHNNQQNKGSKEDEIQEQSFTDNLVSDLHSGLHDQYQTFLDQVRLQVLEKSARLEGESRRLQREKDRLAAQMAEVDVRQKALDTQEKEVTEMRRKVEAERAKLVKDSDSERMEIRRQWQKLKDEVARMEEMHQLQQNRVKLDVGGVTFTTSTSTLTRDQDSMLAAMFGGRHALRREDDGTVFIDRDGTHFRYILNFLRDGATEGSLPESQQSLKELLNEAVYYQLAGLVEAIEERLQ